MVRRGIREKAEAIAREQGHLLEHTNEEIDEEVKKIKNRRATRVPKLKLSQRYQLQEESSTGRKKKSRGKKGPLSLQDRILLVHKVLCNHHTQYSVAREMQVS